MGANVFELRDWKHRLQRRPSGTVFPNEFNVFMALEHAPELKGILAYDEFRDRIVLRRDLPELPDDTRARPASLEWGDEHVTWLTAWLNSAMAVRREVVQNVVIATARARPFHSVRDYLSSLAWDGAPRLSGWLKRYLGAKGNEAYFEAAGPKFLMGAVARVFAPGCQMDTILVLEGDQGLGKSTAVQFLGGHEWVRDITGELHTKDAALNIQGVWIGEMAELASIRKSDQEIIKGFISRRIDHYRPPYGRNSVDRPRHTVFIATTNESEYLQDPAGARRFWPVECTRIDLVGLERDRDQLWAEAVALYREGKPWHFSAIEARLATLEQDARQRLSPVDSVVLEYLDTLRSNNIHLIDMRQVLADVFELNAREDPGKAGGLAVQVARTLIRSGWKRLKPTGRGPTRRQQYEYKEPESAYEPCEPYVGKPGRASNGSQIHSQASQASQGEIEDIPF